MASTNQCGLNIFWIFGFPPEHGSAQNSWWQSLWLVHQSCVDACEGCGTMIVVGPLLCPHYLFVVNCHRCCITVRQPLNWVKLSCLGKPNIVPWTLLWSRDLSNYVCIGAWGLGLLPLRILVYEVLFFSLVFAAHLQKASIFTFSQLLWLIVEIPYQGTYCLTRLKGKTKMEYQSLKGLFAFGGQAQVIFNLKWHMLWGVILNQLNCFTLGRLVLWYLHLYIFHQQLEHKVGIGGIASFKFCHLWFPWFFEFSGCHLKAVTKVFPLKIFLQLQMYPWAFFLMDYLWGIYLWGLLHVIILRSFPCNWCWCGHVE